MEADSQLLWTEHECRANGAQRMAYPSVVAGGADACTIHYLRNDKVRGGAAPTSLSTRQREEAGLSHCRVLPWPPLWVSSAGFICDSSCKPCSGHLCGVVELWACAAAPELPWGFHASRCPEAEW
jgi:hypothetical protein